VACVRARLAPLGGERGHSKSGLHPWYPLKGVPIFIFLPHDFLAVTVTRHAEKHFALLFSAGNSYTVYIRPSAIPGNSRIFLQRFLGAGILIKLLEIRSTYTRRRVNQAH